VTTLIIIALWAVVVLAISLEVVLLIGAIARKMGSNDC